MNVFENDEINVEFWYMVMMVTRTKQRDNFVTHLMNIISDDYNDEDEMR